MANNTGNPVPSDSALDFQDNTQNLDTTVNSQSSTWTDRLGVTRPTLQGQIDKLGYEPPVDYSAAISFTSADRTKTIDRDGIIYAPLPSEIPFTTSGTWSADDDNKFYVVQGVTPDSVGEYAILQFNDLSEAINSDVISDGSAVNLKNKIDGSGDGGLWDVVLTSTVTPNGDDIVQSVSDPSLSLVFRRTSQLRYANKTASAVNVACAIRQTTQGGGWSFIADGNHAPAGFAGDITVSNLEVIVPYSENTTKIGAVPVTVDEVFAHKLSVGASVGLDSIKIKFYADLNILVDNESASVPVSGTNPVSFSVNQYQNPAFVTVTKDTDGAILVDHPNTAADGNIFESRVVTNGFKSYQTNTYTVTQNAGAVKYAQYEKISGVAQYNGSSWDVFTSTLNKPVATWDTDQLLITHEDVKTTLHAVNVSPRDTFQRLAVNSVNNTQFKVRFYDPSTGSQITTPSATMKIYFCVESNMVQREDTIGRTLINVGKVQLDPDYVFLSNGNFWINGVLED